MIQPTLEAAARAVIAQWDTPNWKLDAPTASLIEDMRKALAAPPSHGEAEPVAWRYPSSYDGRWEIFPNNELWKIGGYAHRHPEAQPLYAAPPSERKVIEARDAMVEASEAERFPKTLGIIHQAIDAYVKALVAREHGGVAQNRAFEAICSALGRAPTQEMDAARVAINAALRASGGTP